MSRPDVETLDALVLGTDAPEDHAAWEALVRNPGGADMFREAVARRRRRDLVASALLGRPWLARAIAKLSAMSRQTKAAPTSTFSLLFPDAELDALVTATLGPAEEGPGAEILAPHWGQVVPVRMRVGDRITLEPSPGADPVDVRYVCQGAEGTLPTRTWKLEAGEAPVLLVALVGSAPEETLAQAMVHAKAMAGIVLLDESWIR